MHATSSTYTSPKTPTCEIPSNGVVEISLLPVCTGETWIYTRSRYPEAVSTLHCALENGADLHVNERQKIRHYRARSTEERRRIRKKNNNAKSLFFYFAQCVHKLELYSDLIHLFDWKSAVEHDGGV